MWVGGTGVYAYERSTVHDGLLLVQQSRNRETRTGEKRTAFHMAFSNMAGKRCERNPISEYGVDMGRGQIGLMGAEASDFHK
jgi:hypothetical protein